MRDHRPAGDGVQDLRPVGMHADPLAGGENDREAAADIGSHALAPVGAASSRQIAAIVRCLRRRTAVKQNPIFTLRQNASRGAAK